MSLPVTLVMPCQTMRLVVLPQLPWQAREEFRFEMV